MRTPSAKETLHRYLRSVRRDLEWKTGGLSDYHLRAPMTRTGTNLLGLVRHATGIEGLAPSPGRRPEGGDA